MMQDLAIHVPIGYNSTWPKRQRPKTAFRNVQGDSAEAVLQWLDGNEFGHDETDKAIFADHVARGRCFVTAKIAPGKETQQGQIVAEGMVAPLTLTFPTDDPVYPLALTANASDETEILIYTLSDRKLTCGR